MEEETCPEILLLTAEQDMDAVEIPIKEELVEEVMQELYKEIHPKMTSLNVSFGTESCGASVSDSASTVMAGIKPVGPTGEMNYNWELAGDYRRYEDQEKKEKINGCDGQRENDADDDEWLARVLSWGPLEVDPIPGF